ncbi:NAD(+)/NADH kinase [Microbacteriaceae bacterium VKM Ac-2855]|nr:NAD(+)/NADH kinase [Microbacteriaceae bacterium VKM Ac-2855]
MTVVNPADPAARARAAVVYNPTKIDLDTVRAAVTAAEKNAGWGDTLWLSTSEEDPGQGATRRALVSGASMVIAAGGDGTVRAVAEIVAGSDASLALLPSGTGNLLARNLKLTLNDLDNAVETAFTGVDRDIDIAEIRIRRINESVDTHAFLVMAGVGLDAKMLANTNEELKAKVGWLAYVSAIVKALRDSNQLRMQYRLDEKNTRHVRAHTVIVGNCGTLTANMLLLPDAVIDDGELDVVFFRPESFYGWLQIIRKIIWENGVVRRIRGGKHLLTADVDALNYVRGRSLTVRLSRPDEIELDGDGFGTAVGFKTSVRPGGLTVRVPADHATA